MSDVNCKCCGEPYSTYSLRHEVSEWDDQPDDAYEKFMAGEGCPTCDWGEKEGEVSLSRTTDSETLDEQHFVSAVRNTDEDPIKFFDGAAFEGETEAADLVDVESSGSFAHIEIDGVAAQSVAVDFGADPPTLLVHEKPDSQNPQYDIRLPKADSEQE